MLSVPYARSRSMFFLWAVCTLGGCTDDASKRLSDALAQVGVKDVAITEAKVSATCAMGDTAEVPTADLERNFLGLSNPKKVVVVAKQLAKDCEDKDSAKKRAEAQRAKLQEVTKQLGIDPAGLADDVVKKAICAKLTERLPRKDPDRSVEAAKNMREWSCPPAPPPAALPTGLWQVDVGSAKDPKKPQVSYARLQADDGNRMTLRCTATKKAPKPELYVQLADKTKVKQGTKAIMVAVDGGRPTKWKVNVAKDLSAVFVEPKPAVKARAPASKVALFIPTKKGSATVTFLVKGLAEALKPLPKGCP